MSAQYDAFFIKDKSSLFNADSNEAADYCEAIFNLYLTIKKGDYESVNQMFGEHPDERIRYSGLKVCRIPFALRVCGIREGLIILKEQSIDHILGMVSSKDAHENSHDIRFGELYTFPYYFANPDAVFRSNSDPNGSIIVVKELKNGEPNIARFENDGKKRSNPIMIATRFDIKGKEDTGLVVTAFEKSSRPDDFFLDLFRYGFCRYVSGDRSSSMYTYAKKALGDVESSGIMTRDKAYKLWDHNVSENHIVHVISSSAERGKVFAANLAGIGYRSIVTSYNTFRANILSYDSIKKNVLLACDPMDYNKVLEARKYFGLKKVKKIDLVENYLPAPIFSEKIRMLDDYRDFQTRNDEHER